MKDGSRESIIGMIVLGLVGTQGGTGYLLHGHMVYIERIVVLYDR